MQHVEQLGHGHVGVADHRVVRLVSLGLLDVLGPLAMVLDRVDAEPDDLAVALLELGLEPGHVAQLGRADRREVLRVGEQDRPAVADPLVEVDRAFRGLGREVRCFVAYPQCHGHLRCRVLD